MDSNTANALAPIFGVLAFVLPICWVIVTRMKIKNGYPLENAWGKAVYPKSADEEMERIRLLSQENAQLRAEIGSIKDRLATVERIITDAPARLSDEIDALRRIAN
ncbi:MAG: hypothetical protein AABZ45_07020 [Pseudomonadota bacterium]